MGGRQCTLEALDVNIDALVAATWQGRHVLVTGHTGFKGAWLCLWLARMGARVTGFALAPEGRPNLFELAAVGSKVQSTIGDLRDAGARLEALEIDSVTMVEVIFALEEAFDVALPLDLSLAEMDLSGLARLISDLVQARP